MSIKTKAQPVKPPKGFLKNLPLTQVVRRPDLQFRAGGTDPDHVDDLAEVLKAGGKLPPIQIRRVEGMGTLLRFEPDGR